MKGKIAIIGASYLQVPLIQQAQIMGYETHVFAWAANDVGERIADYFYPISIVEKEQILVKCREIGIGGICTIASDLAVLTVNYVAEKMNLVGNSMQSTVLSTNKHAMREAFLKNGNPSPRSVYLESVKDFVGYEMNYPLIVKPVDRSGSRGITKISCEKELAQACEYAKSVGFDKHVLVEEFAEGDEYSVESISQNGQHHILAITRKFTTDAPHFIETGHLEPAGLDSEIEERIVDVVSSALDTLEVRNGASHAEIKVDSYGQIKIIEIGARMGGDFIGSDLVQLSTGVNFVENVIRVAMNLSIDITPQDNRTAAGVRFIFCKRDIDVIERIKKDGNCTIIRMHIDGEINEKVTDSSNRHGYCIFTAAAAEIIQSYLLM